MRAAVLPACSRAIARWPAVPRWPAAAYRRSSSPTTMHARPSSTCVPALAQSEEQAARAQTAELSEQLQALRRSLLELNNQLEALRGEMARLRGSNEQLQRDVSEVQRKQTDIGQAVDDRLRKLEPQKVTLDGKEFIADPEEKRQYDEAIALLRGGDFDKASQALRGLLEALAGQRLQRRRRASGWATRCTASATTRKPSRAFRAFVARSPDSERAPEALLAIANSQVEMKDKVAARKTLDELIKAYPKSEAAVGRQGTPGVR